MSELTAEDLNSLLEGYSLNEDNISDLSDEEDSDIQDVAQTHQDPPPPEPSDKPEPPRKILEKVKRILMYMQFTENMDFTSFVDAVLWGDQACIADSNVQGTRTNFINSPELPSILERIWKPPRSSARPVDAVLLKFVRDTWMSLLTSELQKVAKFFTSPKGDNVTTEVLTSLKFAKLHDQILAVTPHLWDTLSTLAYSVRQEKRNTHKDPVKIIIMVISMLSYCRSHNRNLIQKAFSIYAKFRGLSAKAFEAFHAAGILMSYKWTTNSVERISSKAMQEVILLLAFFSFLLSYDNIQPALCVFSQRMDHNSEFGNGCAAIVYIKRDAHPLSAEANRAFQVHCAQGLKNLITVGDIFRLTSKHSATIQERMVYHVLRILLQSVEFEVGKYTGHNSNLLRPPAWIDPLPVGKEHTTVQYLLGSVNIPEASYEDQKKLLEEWLRQLQRSSPEAQKQLSLEQLIPLCGNQLTIDRPCVLFRFRADDSNSFDRVDWILLILGWFHLQMAYAQSLFKQYLGMTKGDGLRRAFSPLKCKGLQTASIKGPFHATLEEAIYHVAEAHILVDWKAVGKVSSLSELRERTPEEPCALATALVSERASTDALISLDRLWPNKPDQVDEVFRQTIRWGRDALQYLVLDEAIKNGDVGMMEAMLPTLFFRFAGGRNPKYMVEVLELLQGLEREWTPEVSEFIRKHCWVLNFTGRRDSHVPVDQAQEHNIKDIKVTYRSEGPQINWDYLKKLHPAIPVIRSLCDHMEHEFGTITRGKKHTVPQKQKDIEALVDMFQKSKQHNYVQGRQLKGMDKAQDYYNKGQAKLMEGKVLGKWVDNRTFKRSDAEEWGFELED